MWWILLGGFLLSIPAMLLVPEPVRRQPGALRSLRPRVGLPRENRGAFFSGVPGLVALWALGGLYLSLGPQLAATIIGSDNLVWGGVMVVLLAGVGSCSALLFRAVPPAVALPFGMLGLFVGVAMTVAAIASSSTALLLTGTAVAGVAYGPAFTGLFRRLSALAHPDDRAAIVAAIYTVSYLSFSVPALLAGIATTRWGLHDASLVYAAAVTALTAITGAMSLAASRAARVA